MQNLSEVIRNTPIIDHHAHNLLLPTELAQHSLLSITSEAAGPALNHAKDTLSHLRAVKQLAQVLDCEPTWEAVEARIDEERGKKDDVWAKRCFEGIETVLVDDGLDESTVHPYSWHDRLTRSKCKRIVRIERLAEQIIQKHFATRATREPNEDVETPCGQVLADFMRAIEEACSQPEVVGFKSVICYRTGLAVPPWEEVKFQSNTLYDGLLEIAKSKRLEHEIVGPAFLHFAIKIILKSRSSTGHPKPLQLHTGLGDNDITLRLSNPSYLQSFIKTYPELPIVLLHASYPFTREAGYLASVYENVYLDIGEVFPFVSHDGQEKVIRQALELTPTSKLLWSTDGHWFEVTYLLAVIQVREALECVLGEYIDRGTLSTAQACRVVQDLFFKTANQLYNLSLTLSPLSTPSSSRASPQITSASDLWSKDLYRRASFFATNPDAMSFFAANPDITYLRLQWLDYVSTLRVRNLRVPHALSLFGRGKYLGIAKAVFGLLQNDYPTEGCGGAVGDYKLVPCFDSLRVGPTHELASYATVQCEFREQDGSEVDVCPRTALRKIIQRAKAERDVEFLVGFETEVIFMHYSDPPNGYGWTTFGETPVSQGHSWSSSRALDRPKMIKCLETIADTIQKAGIILEQFQTEASRGQYEYVTGPLSPVAAVDVLITTRDIIQRTAIEFDMRATFVPKPALDQVGSGQHIHLSTTVNGKEDPAYMSFYAGILKHLRALCAFTYPLPESYTRVGDGLWAGGRYVAWGTGNRETPLRRIEASHWELRFVDGFANPYLALAAILAAGFQGLVDGEEMRWEDCGEDPARLSVDERENLGIQKMIPLSAEEAWEALEEDESLRMVVGEKVADYQLRVKRHETEILSEMSGMDHPKRRNWLIERY